MWINSEEWDSTLLRISKLELAAENKKAEYKEIKTVLNGHDLYKTQYGYVRSEIFPAGNITEDIRQLKEYLHVEKKNDPPRTYLIKKQKKGK